jgi:hypothetical protein
VAELLVPAAAAAVVVAVVAEDEGVGVVDLSVLGLVVVLVLAFAPFLGLLDGAFFNCQLTSSWVMNFFKRSKYWLYSSTSLWPAPSTQSGSTAFVHFS